MRMFEGRQVAAGESGSVVVAGAGQGSARLLSL